MYDNLVSYINSHLQEDISQNTIDKIKEVFKYKKVRKHQYFLHEGEVCKKAGFIVKGAMKQYTIDDKGKENIIGLYIENWWVSDKESLSNGSQSPYFIDAIEPTEMLVVAKEDMDRNLSKLPFMVELRNALIEREAYHLMRRVHAANTLTAKQRLDQLEKDYPAFSQRFPQRIIASYLGMTKETLSRIRSSTS